MSRKERNQMMVMAGVQRQELTQGQAAELLGGDRQAQRVWWRYQDEGAAGLGHRRRGRPGLRHKPPAASTPAMAGAQTVLWGDGAVGGN